MGTLKRLPIVLAVGVFAAWFVLFRPPFLGGSTSYVWVSGVSMEPTLHDGEVVVVRKQESYSVGDVVAFRVPVGQPAEGATVIHRIVGGTSQAGYVMQGDNRTTIDVWHPSNEDILGETWFVVPGGGAFLVWARDPINFGGLAAAITVFLMLAAPPKIRKLAEPAIVVRPQDAWSLAELAARAAAPVAVGEPESSNMEPVIDLTRDRISLTDHRAERSGREVGRR